MKNFRLLREIYHSHTLGLCDMWYHNLYELNIIEPGGKLGGLCPGGRERKILRERRGTKRNNEIVVQPSIFPI